jgi:tRNA A37 threonylcarbamoyladenosine synthetase subunit TsaC/SUA5/YrdC
VAQPPDAPHQHPLSKAELFDRLENRVDIIVDDEEDLTYEVSSILDMTEEEPRLIRQGLGWEKALAWGAELVET